MPTDSIRRVRFSLQTLLLLLTISAMGITVWQLYAEVSPLRAENKRLNEERGTLVVEDATRLCAIKIPSQFAGNGQDAFRVYVPPGQIYLAFVRINSIPKNGFPEIGRRPDHAGFLGSCDGTLFARLEPGETTLALRTVCRGSGRADVALLKHGLDVSANTPEDQWPTVTPDTYSVFGDGVGKITTYVENSRRLVLLRRRIQGVSAESLNVSYTMPEPDHPLDGVMLWLERQQ